jgi:hypothetical protein
MANDCFSQKRPFRLVFSREFEGQQKSEAANND